MIVYFRTVLKVRTWFFSTKLAGDTTIPEPCLEVPHLSACLHFVHFIEDSGLREYTGCRRHLDYNMKLKVLVNGVPRDGGMSVEKWLLRLSSYIFRSLPKLAAGHAFP